MLLVRCRTVDRTRAPSGEHGRKTNLNRHSRASCACLACCWSPLACIQCVGSPRPAVILGRYTFSKKSLENKGTDTKGYTPPWVACTPIQPDLPSSSLLSTSTIAKLASETPAGRQRRRVRVHAINLDQTLPIGFFMAATASGLDAAMPQKQPSQWEPWRTTLWL